MYCSVPRIAPTPVRLAGVVGNIDWRAPSTTGASVLASPKSSSLAPCLVSMMLPGLRSRWMMPARCALSRADGHLDGDLERLISRQRAVREPGCQRHTLQVLQDEECRAVMVANVIERADVRMRQLGDCASFPIETFSKLPVYGQQFRQDFYRDGALEASVPSFVHLAHPAGSKRGEDFVGTEPRAGCQSHEEGFGIITVELRITSERRAGFGVSERPARCVEILAMRPILRGIECAMVAIVACNDSSDPSRAWFVDFESVRSTMRQDHRGGRERNTR